MRVEVTFPQLEFRLLETFPLVKEAHEAEEVEEKEETADEHDGTLTSQSDPGCGRGGGRVIARWGVVKVGIVGGVVIVGVGVSRVVRRG